MNLFFILLMMECLAAISATPGDPCSYKPCLNDGECVNTGDSNFECRCGIGYKGEICDEMVCVDLNDTCGELTLLGHCTAYPETMEIACRKSCHVCGVCHAVECPPNRVCNELSHHSYTCDCAQGHTGENCEKQLCDEECQNGGVCNGVGCTCPPGYTGSVCTDCLDVDEDCAESERADECETNSRRNMAYCRSSCRNCHDEPCTEDGEFCVRYAICQGSQCQCEAHRKGDPKMECAKEEESLCILRHEPQVQSYGGATADLHFPCKYRLSFLTVALEDTDDDWRNCSVEVFGFSMISESGNYYPAASEVILTSANSSESSVIKFDVDPGGIAFADGQDVMQGSSRSLTLGGLNIYGRFNDKDRFVVLYVPQCHFRLKFRSYNEDEDDRDQTQSRVPGIAITTGADSRFDSDLHRYPASLCGRGGSISDGTQLYSDRAKELGLDSSGQAVLYDALGQNLDQHSSVQGLDEAVSQSRDTCQRVIQLFNGCGDQDNKAGAIKACYSLLSDKFILGCLGPLAIDAFQDCLDLFCNNQLNVCKDLHDTFKDAVHPSQQLCEVPSSLKDMCKNSDHNLLFSSGSLS